MARRADDFHPKTILALGQRAGYFCSNPSCRRPTSGPHSDPAKALITGEAAHIRAAQPNGPRYDPNQTPEERRSPQNGIWLCAVCSKKVDTDWKAWPAEKIHQMKSEHEQWVLDEGMIPRLPEVTLVTRHGLRVGNMLPKVSQEMLSQLREQELSVRNPNRVPLHRFSMTLRLPEAVVGIGIYNFPTGCNAELTPLEKPWTVTGAGTGEVSHRPNATATFIMKLAMLPPSEELQTAWYTADPKYQVVSSGPLPEGFVLDDLKKVGWLSFYIEGSYQFHFRGEYITHDFFVPLRYVYSTRIVTSLPTQSTSEPYQLAPTMEFGGVTFKG